MAGGTYNRILPVHSERSREIRVNALIESLFGVCFADASGAWRLLLRIGRTFHRPECRATQRDELAILRQ